MSEVLTPEVQVETTATVAAPPPSSRVVWWIVGLAFGLRFGWVLLGHTYRFRLPDHFDFGQEIGCIARSLVLGRGFASPFPEWSGPTTWIGPIYPFLLAYVFKVFGLYSTVSALVMLGLNCLFSALTCWPLFCIAREVTNRRVALMATLLWAIVPTFMTWAVFSVWDASFTTLIVTSIVWVGLNLGRRVTLRTWLAFGVLWGFAALLNPSLLSFLPCSVGYVAWQARARRERWMAPAALCCFVVLLTVTPWFMRNYRVFGKPVFIRGNFWAEMRYGNAIYGDGTWLAFTHPEVNPIERQKFLRMGEQPYFESKKRETLQFIRQHPGFFTELCFRRVLFYWWDFGDITEATPDVLMAMARRAFSTVALLGLLFLVFKRRPGWFLISSLLLTFPVLYYLTYPYGRYRHVLEPILLICAVYCLAQVEEFEKLFPTDRTNFDGSIKTISV